MCAERLGQFVTLALVLATFDLARGTDATNPPEGPQDRGSQQKGRLSLQNTGKCVRPCDQELPGESTVHPRSAPWAFRPDPDAHPRQRKLLGWRGTCQGKRKAKRGLRRARSARNPHVLAG